MTLHIPLERARWAGIIGSALTLFLYVPGFGGILNLIGALFLLGAVKSISTHVHSRRIFQLFVVYLVLLILSAIVALAASGYIITRIEAGEASAGTQLLEALVTILPLIALFFFMRSYTLISRKTDIRWFSLAGKVAFSIAALVALAGLIFTFTDGSRLLAQLSAIISVLGYVAVPVLGIISYVRLNPQLLKYRYKAK